MSLRLCVVLCALLVPAVCTGSDLVITEVFYDHTGADDGFEWVEIYNATPEAIVMDGYSLGWGGTSYTYGTANLGGIVLGCSTYVVGGPLSDAENGNPAYDFIVNFSPDIQNGGSPSDGVALFDVTASMIEPTTIPIDAVIYGSPNSNGLMDETGAPGTPDTNGGPAGSSIERADWAGNWQVNYTPSPGRVPFLSPACDLSGVPKPNWGSTVEESDWGAVKAMYR